VKQWGWCNAVCHSSKHRRRRRNNRVNYVQAVINVKNNHDGTIIIRRRLMTTNHNSLKGKTSTRSFKNHGVPSDYDKTEFDDESECNRHRTKRIRRAQRRKEERSRGTRGPKGQENLQITTKQNSMTNLDTERKEFDGKGKRSQGTRGAKGTKKNSEHRRSTKTRHQQFMN
jgi:hypothetical protein